MPLVIDGGGSEPLLKKLNITAHPSTFFNSPNSVVLERIVGYVAPDAMSSRLNSVRPTLPVAKVAGNR